MGKGAGEIAYSNGTNKNFWRDTYMKKLVICAVLALSLLGLSGSAFAGSIYKGSTGPFDDDWQLTEYGDGGQAIMQYGYSIHG